MARAGGKDRGITQRKGRDGWWVRIFHNGREPWHKCDTKSQAKALYGRLKADAREGRYSLRNSRSKKTSPCVVGLCAARRVLVIVAWSMRSGMVVAGVFFWENGYCQK